MSRCATDCHLFAYTTAQPGALAMQGPRGFTLVELIVVVSIIVLLLTILMPSINRAIEAAMVAQDGSNQRQLGVGFANYASDYSRHWPARDNKGHSYLVYDWGEMSNWDSHHIIEPYVPPSPVYMCPFAESDRDVSWDAYWPNTSGVGLSGYTWPHYAVWTNLDSPLYEVWDESGNVVPWQEVMPIRASDSGHNVRAPLVTCRLSYHPYLGIQSTAHDEWVEAPDGNTQEVRNASEFCALWSDLSVTYVTEGARPAVLQLNNLVEQNWVTR